MSCWRRRRRRRLRKSSPAPAGASAQNRKLTIALMPKSKGNAYFISCKMGANGRQKTSEWI